jgi:hypothetical protein
MRVNRKTGTAHASSAVAFTENRRLVVTLWEGGPKDLEGRLEARILDPTNGIEQYRRTPPGRLAHVIRGQFYAYVQHPHPKVIRYDSSRPWLN